MTSNKEIWRPIQNFPLYDCSSCGRIRNHKTGRILKTNINTRGYMHLTLRRNNKAYTERVHRLVALTFLPIANSDQLDVNHIDGDKLNNHVSNLEWCTRSENIQHGIRNGLIKTNDYGHKRKAVRVVETNEVFSSIRECARELKIDQSEISQYLLGRAKKVKGYHFELI